MRKIFVFTFGLVLIALSSAVAAPNINGASGVFADGQKIIINGYGFGVNGPHNILYDSFSGGTTGQKIPIDGSEVGGWSGVSSVLAPTYADTAHSGRHSMQIKYEGETQQFFKNFSQDTREVFMSFWVRVPDGTPFPSGDVETFASKSAWKFTWLMDGDSTIENDLTVPSYTGLNSFQITGNDWATDSGSGTQSGAYIGSSWWSWNRWMRLSFWLKANESDPTNPGTIYAQTLTEGLGLAEIFRTDKYVFDSDVSNIKRWTQIRFPGWVAAGGNSARPVYDDIYVAAGPFAAARVEVGNNSNYKDCTNLSILTPERWDDNQIDVVFRQGSFAGGQKGYLFVFDKNGLVNATGFPITIGSSAVGEPITPGLEPAQNLRDVPVQ